MERERTDAATVVDIIVDFNAKRAHVMGPIKKCYELFGIKLYSCEGMRSNELLVVDNRSRGYILTLKEEELCRLIRED